MATNVFDQLDQALDAESWDWLNENLPNVAEAVQSAVTKGASPEDVRRRVMRQVQRYELAQRCEAAARWLARGK